MAVLGRELSREVSRCDLSPTDDVPRLCTRDMPDLGRELCFSDSGAELRDEIEVTRVAFRDPQHREHRAELGDHRGVLHDLHV